MAFHSSLVAMRKAGEQVSKRRAGVLRTRRSTNVVVDSDGNAVQVERSSSVNSTSSQSIPSFKEFMHRSKVISQYRELMRTLAVIPDEQWKKQLQKDIREGYANYRTSTDSITIQMALREGDQQMKRIQTVVGHHPRSKTLSMEKDPDSWINTVDKEDPRGRVGEEWPWNK